jgi:hypothetical protein
MRLGRRTPRYLGYSGVLGGPDLLLLLCAELLEPAKARSVSRLDRAGAVHRRRTPATEQRAVKRIQRKARRAPNPSACSCARCARTSYSYASSQRLRPMTALVADPRPSPLPPRPIAAPAHRLGRCRPEPAARAARSTPRVLAMLARELGERVARRDRRVQQELLVRRHDAHLIAAQWRTQRYARAPKCAAACECVRVRACIRACMVACMDWEGASAEGERECVVDATAACGVRLHRSTGSARPR